MKKNANLRQGELSVIGFGVEQDYTKAQECFDKILKSGTYSPAEKELAQEFIDAIALKAGFNLYENSEEDSPETLLKNQICAKFVSSSLKTSGARSPQTVCLQAYFFT